MCVVYGDILRQARDCTGLSRERAAELLDISFSSLCEYEIGRRTPPAERVCKMIEIYSAPQLAVEYLVRDPVFLYLVGAIEVEDRVTSVMRYQLENADVVQAMPDISRRIISRQSLTDEHRRDLQEAIQTGIGVLVATA